MSFLNPRPDIQNFSSTTVKANDDLVNPEIRGSVRVLFNADREDPISGTPSRASALQLMNVEQGDHKLGIDFLLDDNERNRVASIQATRQLPKTARYNRRNIPKAFDRGRLNFFIQDESGNQNAALRIVDNSSLVAGVSDRKTKVEITHDLSTSNITASNVIANSINANSFSAASFDTASLKVGQFNIQSSSTVPTVSEGIFTSDPTKPLLEILHGGNVVGAIGSNAPVVRSIALDKTTVSMAEQVPSFTTEKQALRTNHIHITRANINDLLGKDIVKDFIEFQTAKNSKDAGQDGTLATHTTEIAALQAEINTLFGIDGALALTLANILARRNLYPAVDNTYRVGLSNLRWSEVNGVTVNATGVAASNILLLRDSSFRPTSDGLISYTNFNRYSSGNLTQQFTPTVTGTPQFHTGQFGTIKFVYVPVPTFSYTWAQFGLTSFDTTPIPTITDLTQYYKITGATTAQFLSNRAFIQNITSSGFQVSFTPTEGVFITPTSTVLTGNTTVSFDISIAFTSNLFDSRARIKIYEDFQASNIIPHASNFDLGSDVLRWGAVYGNTTDSSNIVSDIFQPKGISGIVGKPNSPFKKEYLKELYITKSSLTDALALATSPTPSISYHNVIGTSNIVTRGSKVFSAAELIWTGGERKYAGEVPALFNFTFETPFVTPPTIAITDTNKYVVNNSFGNVLDSAVGFTPFFAVNITTTGFTLAAQATIVGFNYNNLSDGLYFSFSGGNPPYTVRWSATGTGLNMNNEDRLKVKYPLELADIYLSRINGQSFIFNGTGVTTIDNRITNNYFADLTNIVTSNITIKSKFEDKSASITVTLPASSNDEGGYYYLYDRNWTSFIPYTQESINMSYPNITVTSPSSAFYGSATFTNSFKFRSSTDGLYVYYNYTNNEIVLSAITSTPNTWIVTKDGKKYIYRRNQWTLDFILEDRYTPNLTNIGLSSTCNIYVQGAISANKYYEGGNCDSAHRLLSRIGLFETFSGTALPSFINNTVYDSTCNIWICKTVANPPVTPQLYEYLANTYGVVAGSSSRNQSEAPVLFSNAYTAPTAVAGSTEPPPNNPNPNVPPSDPPSQPVGEPTPPNPPPPVPPLPPVVNPPPIPVGGGGGGNIGGIVGAVLGAIIGAAFLALVYKYGGRFLRACCERSTDAYASPNMETSQLPDGDIAVRVNQSDVNALSMIRNGRAPGDRSGLSGQSSFMQEISSREAAAVEEFANRI